MGTDTHTGRKESKRKKKKRRNSWILGASGKNGSINLLQIVL